MVLVSSLLETPSLDVSNFFSVKQEGATNEDIERLPKYKFRRIGDFEKQNGEIQESYGGIMTECDTDSPIEHVLPFEDAVCLILVISHIYIF